MNRKHLYLAIHGCNCLKDTCHIVDEEELKGCDNMAAGLPMMRYHIVWDEFAGAVTLGKSS